MAYKIEFKIKKYTINNLLDGAHTQNTRLQQAWS